MQQVLLADCADVVREAVLVYVGQVNCDLTMLVTEDKCIVSSDDDVLRALHEFLSLATRTPRTLLSSSELLIRLFWRHQTAGI